MSSFDTQRQKAFDFCADATKQLITLATGFIAVTITFAKDFVINVSDNSKPWAYWSWGFYAVSIDAGMATLLAMTAELEPKNTSAATPTIRQAVATWSAVQIVTFGIAIVLTVVFGICAAKNTKSIHSTVQTASQPQKDTLLVKDSIKPKETGYEP